MSTKRGLIAEALKAAFEVINKEDGYNTNLYKNVQKRFIFPDENPQFPLISFTTGIENITYQPGGPQDRYLQVKVRAYVEDPEDSISATEALIQDIEKVVENNSRLVLGDRTTIRDMRVTTINTDEGILSPIGVAEIQLIVEY